MEVRHLNMGEWNDNNWDYYPRDKVESWKKKYIQKEVGNQVKKNDQSTIL